MKTAEKIKLIKEKLVYWKKENNKAIKHCSKDQYGFAKIYNTRLRISNQKLYFYEDCLIYLETGKLECPPISENWPGGLEIKDLSEKERLFIEKEKKITKESFEYKYKKIKKFIDSL